MLDRFTRLVAFAFAFTFAFTWFALCLPASAQGAPFDLSSLTAAGAGTQRYTSHRTGRGPSGMGGLTSQVTGQQNAGLSLNPAGFGGLAPVFGMSGYGSYSNQYSGANGYGDSSPGAALASGNLANLQNALPNTTFAQYHPRRTEVLENDSAIYNQINADYGSLGGNYPQLDNQALAIQNQEESYAAQNGGFITTAQQAQLDQEVSTLGQQVAVDNANALNGGF
jgi:hypothetical protein